ncbi:Methylase involved in ubiquinone/menaquinone biosynthesis [Methanocella conradii HZ254]|uniref:Methylase involved in ubiquinone/menaquinone biosynthesis n=2 Tax=Methanocella TaxID=570266 RepID=H8I842_METCZ|nr:class I SAM-dependent methyltransferase [Methanocella conradii]AFD00860.1 Methylase involved in ubiquinone/menaquinone biosynthesis [Methanocella conradii HZ254]
MWCDRMVYAGVEAGPGKRRFSYLDLLASIGSAKHIGGKGATETLINEAGIRPGSLVLDVGCGMGKTSCMLAKERGCHVIGLDIMPRMVRESRERARRLGVDDKAAFLRCDARSLPFKPETFDAVIVESVTIFVEEVEKALAEYRRVVKNGGAVCDNEVCVTRDAMGKMVDRLDDLKSIFTAFCSMTSKGILTFEDWKELYEKLFGNVRASHHLLDMSVEMETRREDGLKSIAAGIKSMWLYMTNPEARKIIDEGRKMMSFQGEFGYGLFVSHKRG